MLPAVQNYVVTYVREVVQTLPARNIQDAADQAKRACANVKGARVMSIYREDLQPKPGA